MDLHVSGLGTGVIECSHANYRAYLGDILFLQGNSFTDPPVLCCMTSRMIGASLLAASFFATLPAWAHAFLERASPEVGATEQGSPEAISLWFSEELEPAFSTVSVLDQARHRVEAGNARVDPADAKLLRTPLRPLPTGVYRVSWRVVSVDTHTTEGNFTFRVTAR